MPIQGLGRHLNTSDDVEVELFQNQCDNRKNNAAAFRDHSNDSYNIQYATKLFYESTYVENSMYPTV